jgi:starch synthase
MRLLFIAAEAAPLMKVGGLADVAGALPRQLRHDGVDAAIVMPLYRKMRAVVEGLTPITAGFLALGERQEELRIYLAPDSDGTPRYLLDIPAAFERDAVFGEFDDDARFILFARGVMHLMQQLREVLHWNPDVVHANDWHTALVLTYIRTRYAYTFGHIATVFTIHNLAYQGEYGGWSRHLAGLDEWGGVEHNAGLPGDTFNFMARGLLAADMINTVSPTYASEILSPAYGERLDGILRTMRDRHSGILNGIDTVFFNPDTDPQIAATYSVNDLSGKAACKAALRQIFNLPTGKNPPIAAIVSRLASQNGNDLIDSALTALFALSDIQLVVLGSGEPHWEQRMRELAARYPDRLAVHIGFDAALANRIYAGCDLFLMPSRFEPGGLGQLIAMRYGAVPVVRAVGGLSDTVREGPNGNGFRFSDYTPEAFAEAIQRAVQCYRQPAEFTAIQLHNMSEDYSWNRSAKSYIHLYQQAIQHRKGTI